MIVGIINVYIEYSMLAEVAKVACAQARAVEFSVTAEAEAVITPRHE